MRERERDGEKKDRQKRRKKRVRDKLSEYFCVVADMSYKCFVQVQKRLENLKCRLDEK